MQRFRRLRLFRTEGRHTEAVVVIRAGDWSAGCLPKTGPRQRPPQSWTTRNDRAGNKFVNICSICVRKANQRSISWKSVLWHTAVKCPHTYTQQKKTKIWRRRRNPPSSPSKDPINTFFFDYPHKRGESPKRATSDVIITALAGWFYNRTLNTIP